MRLTRLRRRSSGDGAAGGGPSTRRAEAAKPIASATVGPGAVSRRSAVPAARTSSLAPADRAVPGSCRRPSRSRSVPVTSRGMGTGGMGRGRGFPLGVVDLLEQGDSAEPVGDRVAELAQQRRSIAFQALHVHRFPQGAGGVQRRGQDDLGQVEQLAQRARGGQRDPAQVVVQVEVGVDDPPRRRGRDGRHHHLLPHPDDHPAGPVHRLPQPAPVGRAVEEFHAEERGPGGRVRLAPVHQVVQRAELVGRRRRMGHLAIIVLGRGRW